MILIKHLVIAFFHKAIAVGVSPGTALGQFVSPLRPLLALASKPCWVILRPSTVEMSARVMASRNFLV